MRGQAPSILVVEDDEATRDTISGMLYEAGFVVDIAAAGPDALELIEEKAFDLVVANVRLPGGLTGLELAQQARRQHPSLRFLFVAGQREPVVCDPELDDFVAKPFRTFELLGCIWKVLQSNRPNPRVDTAR